VKARPAKPKAAAVQPAAADSVTRKSATPKSPRPPTRGDAGTTGVSAERARALALGLPNVCEVPHFDRAAFRTPRKIFATLAADGSDMNFAFDLATQEAFCLEAPHALTPVAGGWGRMGFTRCDLRRVDEPTFVAALTAAHALANTPKAKRPPKRSRD
jgi:hypothetical protein